MGERIGVHASSGAISREGAEPPSPESAAWTRPRSRKVEALVGLLLAATLLSACGYLSSEPPGLTVEGEFHLTSTEPAMAVEFEASYNPVVGFTTLWHDQVHPGTNREVEGIDGWRQVWDGQDWISLDEFGNTSYDVSPDGVISYRYRLIVALEPGEVERTVPYTIVVRVAWDEDRADQAPPDLEDYEDLTLVATSTYPATDLVP